MEPQHDIDTDEPSHEPNSDAGEAAETDPAAGVDDSPEAAIKRLELERDELTAQWQRAVADYQNLRRRAQADLEAAARRARGEVLAEALTVLDYLDMALATECTTEEGKNLQVGVSMTRGQLASLLERFKVKEIPPSKEFDAQVHQAFATVETTEHPPGEVVEVFRKGWMYGDQVLRHAQVRVATPPQPTATPADMVEDDAEGLRQRLNLPDETDERVSD